MAVENYTDLPLWFREWLRQLGLAINNMPPGIDQGVTWLDPFIEVALQNTGEWVDPGGMETNAALPWGGLASTIKARFDNLVPSPPWEQEFIDVPSLNDGLNWFIDPDFTPNNGLELDLALQPDSTLKFPFPIGAIPQASRNVDCRTWVDTSAVSPTLTMQMASVAFGVDMGAYSASALLNKDAGNSAVFFSKDFVPINTIILPFVIDSLWLDMDDTGSELECKVYYGDGAYPGTWTELPTLAYTDVAPTPGLFIPISGIGRDTTTGSINPSEIMKLTRWRGSTNGSI